MFRKHYFFILILSLSIFLRLYHIDTLTTFGRDQGIDFLTVKDILINHKLTLIGIKISIADFFQGPLYLYMLLPLFWLSSLNPLAGSYTAVLISSLALIILYVLLIRFSNIKWANLTALYYATNLPLVIFGNTPLYQNFLPLFILLTFYFLFSLNLDKRKNLLLSFLTGLMASISAEMHFLAIILVVATFIYFIFYFKTKLFYITVYLIGILTGFSPTIIFELRHDFLNTRLLINYLDSIQQISFHISFLIFSDNNLLIILPALLGIYLLFQKNQIQNQHYTRLKQFTLIILITTLIFCMKSSALGAHYFLPLFFALLLFIPAYLTYTKHQKMFFFLASLLIVINTIITFSQLNNNHGYFMPAGWSLKKIEQVGNIISLDTNKHANFNVASLLDGDTRSYPLRFVLERQGKFPGLVTAYNANNYLYVVARTEEEIVKSTVWEINSLKPFCIGQKWQLEDNVVLFRLDRNLL